MIHTAPYSVQQCIFLAYCLAFFLVLILKYDSDKNSAPHMSIAQSPMSTIIEYKDLIDIEPWLRLFKLPCVFSKEAV